MNNKELIKGTITSKVEDKGFGFITAEGMDYFFHFSQCTTAFESLKRNDNVQFEAHKTSKGLRAVNVELVNDEYESEEK